MANKTFYLILLSLLGGILIIAVVVAYSLLSSLPQRTGEIRVEGLHAPVRVRFDRLGIPDISAENRPDAAFALAYVTAGDRLFQMDLIRRKSAGRLAEIFGKAALKTDLVQRRLDFEGAAQKIVDALPLAQRQALEAYARGVNAYLEHIASLPPEFVLLRYEPAKWSARDSILVVLSMFQLLAWTEADERLLSVMNACLPDEVSAFLTPDTDRFTQILSGGPDSARPIHEVPFEQLAEILESNRRLQVAVRVEPAGAALGSNNWAVNRQKTLDGSAIIANDMHLAISVPNIWYRATMRYQGHLVSGLSLPGVPSIAAGSNGRVAWGFTNFMADVMDLVQLQTDPQHPDHYLTSSGWRKLEQISHKIIVKGASPLIFEATMSEWGPVWPEPLLGQSVAIRWTALDPAAVDLALMDLDRANTIEEAMNLLNRVGAPPQNVLLADDLGNIAWTLMGRFPKRPEGFDGAVSRSWTNKSSAWLGYLQADELPRVVNPPSGFLATANSRNIGRDYPYILGHNFAHGYRTYRISERLERMQLLNEQDLFRLQLDSKTEFYAFYRSLAVSLLTPEILFEKPLLNALKKELDAWDGYARIDSRGLPFLAAFRNLLSKKVFGPFLKTCASLDKSFRYNWYEMETPLRQLLSDRNPKILPDSSFANWNEFLLAILEESAQDLKKRHSLTTLENFTWGDFQDIRITHPLSRAVPWLADFLDMPDRPYDGCSFCVRVMSPRFSASERFVISPGRPQRGILHMPGGQSGHWLSPHYADQHPYWANGLALPFGAEQVDQVLRLIP